MEQGIIPVWKKGYMSTLLSPLLGHAKITAPKGVLPQNGKPVSPGGILCNWWSAPDVPEWESHGTTPSSRTAPH